MAWRFRFIELFILFRRGQRWQLVQFKHVLQLNLHFVEIKNIQTAIVGLIMDHGVVMSWLVRFKLNSRSICDGRKFIIFITKWIERCGSLSYYFRCCLILLLWLFTLLIQKTVWTDNALFTHAHLGPFLKKTVVDILAFKPIHGIVGMIDLSYLWRPVLLSKVLLEKLHRIIVREHTWHARRRWWPTHWFWNFTFRHWKEWLYEGNSFGDRRQYYACI